MRKNQQAPSLSPHDIQSRFAPDAGVSPRPLEHELSSNVSTTGASVEAVERRFSLAISESGIDGNDIVNAVIEAVRGRVGTSDLPEGEAVFLEHYGDLAEESALSFAADYAQAKARQAAIDAAGFLPTAGVAARLGIDESRVRHRTGAGILIAHKFGRDARYPLWQFTALAGRTVPIPGLPDVKAAIDPNMHPYELAGIMTSPQQSLRVRGKAVSPQQWLQSGGAVEPVIDVIRNPIEW